MYHRGIISNTIFNNSYTDLYMFVV